MRRDASSRVVARGFSARTWHPAASAVYEQVFGEREDVELSVLRLFPRPSVADVRKHLLRQDVVLVEGGSLVWLFACACGAGFALTSAYSWRIKTRWFSRAGR